MTQADRHPIARILVVDDSETIREFCQAVLEDASYAVTTAADGMEALEFYTPDPQAYDLVILDVIMPRMGGLETMPKLIEAREDVAILIITGYTDETRKRQAIGKNIRDILAKPFEPDALLESVQAILEGTTAQDDAGA